MFFSTKPFLALTSVALLALASIPVRSQVVLPASGAAGKVSGESVRGDRETRAPQVMAATPSASTASKALYSLDEAMEQQVWLEAQKRLASMESSDPKRALAEYKKFWQARVPHPAVAIPVAMKVVELRLRMKDVAGALLTCDYMQQKYADDPASVQLALQKARVLVSEKRFGEAATTVDEAMPKLLALGPESYPHTSELLLNLAQASIEAGDSGKQEASRLYESVEQIYLRWLKAGTISHSWQMFEALQGQYRQVGSVKQANELLPKAADVLLRMEPTEKNPEGADISVMAARWLSSQGNIKDAEDLYTKVPRYGNPYVTEVSVIDRAGRLLAAGSQMAACKLLREFIPTATAEPKLVALLMLGNTLYRQGDLEDAEANAQKALSLKSDSVSAQNLLKWSKLWQQQQILCVPKNLEWRVTSDKTPSKTHTEMVKVRTFHNTVLSISCDEKQVKWRLLPKQDDSWFLNGLKQTRFIEQEIEVEIPNAPMHAVLQVQAKELDGAESHVSILVTP